MAFPANAEVESEVTANTVVVLEIEVELLKRGAPEGGVPALGVVGCGSKEEVCILVTGVGQGVVLGAGCGVVYSGGEPGEVDGVGGAIGEVAEALMAIAAAKRELVLAPDHVEVLVDVVETLVHAVVPLRTAVGHDDVAVVRVNGREAGLAEVIGQAQLGFVVGLGNRVAFHVHALPILADDGFREEGG